jgi:predicted kinase
MAALAHRCGVPLVILDCRVSPLLARRRLQARQSQGGDPSEANGSILNRQLQKQQPFSPGEWPRVFIVDMTKTINFALFRSQL